MNISKDGKKVLLLFSWFLLTLSALQKTVPHIRNNAGKSNIIPNRNFQSKQTGRKDNTLRILGGLTLQARILVKKESIIQKELLRTVLRVMSFTI